MNHAETIACGRKEHVRPTLCPGELTPIQSRRQWVHGAAERVYRCDECQSVLGLVGDKVEWAMSLASWKGL